VAAASILRAVFVERLRTGARTALLVLAAALPFELVNPIAGVGPLQLSSVELFLYLTLALWGASLVVAIGAGELRLGHVLRRLPAMERAVAGVALAVLLSAAFAAPPRGAAFKFALRSTGGMLLFAAAADLLRARGAVARTATVLVGGAVVAALLAIAEVHLGPAAALLRAFHPQTFQALGAPRASGPLQYPNIAAMYLEAAAPLAVGLWLGGRGEREEGSARRALVGRVAAAALGTFLLLYAVVATASRAGLLGALAGVLAVLAVGARAPERRPVAWGALAAAVAIAALASSSALAGRFRFWHDEDWYRAVIARSEAGEARTPALLGASSMTTENLELLNQGHLRWLRDSPSPVTLSYHWLDARGAVVTLDGVRTPLPADIDPGGRVRVRAVVRAPSQPGRYVLWWDLVHEHTTWFSEHGNPGLRETVEVRGGNSSSAAAQAGFVAPPLGEHQTVPRRSLWRAAMKMFFAHPLSGVGPDNFRHRYGPVLGLAPAQVDERLHANSLYFETLADLGLAGCLAFGFLVVAAFRTARRALRVPATGMLALGMAVALGTHLLHGVLDYFLEFTPTYGQFWLLAGMMAALRSSAEIAP
jgi:hypothetical protein